MKIFVLIAPFSCFLPPRHEDTKVSQSEDQSEILLCVSLCLSAFPAKMTGQDVAYFCFSIFNATHILLIFEYFVSLLMMLFFLSLPRNPKAANLPQTPFSPQNLVGNVINPIESTFDGHRTSLPKNIFRGGFRLKMLLDPFQGHEKIQNPINSPAPLGRGFDGASCKMDFSPTFLFGLKAGFPSQTWNPGLKSGAIDPASQEMACHYKASFPQIQII